MIIKSRIAMGIDSIVTPALRSVLGSKARNALTSRRLKRWCEMHPPLVAT
jgi:hypothetical protein